MIKLETSFDALRKFKRIGKFIILVVIILLLGGTIVLTKNYSQGGNPLERSVYNSDCNVQIVNLQGTLDTNYNEYSDGSETGSTSTEIIAQLMEAEKNERIKGIILSVDSGGGSPVAGSDIADYLTKINKPSVAWFRTQAASAAYWASLGAKKIIANQNSSIGSIGVTLSYIDSTERDKKDGLIFQELSIGKFKDTGNPGKSLTDEEKKLLLNQAEKVYTNFVGAVAHYRNLDEKKVRSIADGSVMLGQDAIQVGLIDELGGISEVKQYLESKIDDQATFCWKQ